MNNTIQEKPAPILNTMELIPSKYKSRDVMKVRYYLIPDELSVCAERLLLATKNYDLNLMERLLNRMVKKVNDYNMIYFTLHNIN